MPPKNKASANRLDQTSNQHESNTRPTDSLFNHVAAQSNQQDEQTNATNSITQNLETINLRNELKDLKNKLSAQTDALNVAKTRYEEQQKSLNEIINQQQKQMQAQMDQFKEMFERLASDLLSSPNKSNQSQVNQTDQQPMTSVQQQTSARPIDQHQLPPRVPVDQQPSTSSSAASNIRITPKTPANNQQAPSPPIFYINNQKQNIKIEEFDGKGDIYDFLSDIEYYASIDKLNDFDKIKLVAQMCPDQFDFGLTTCLT